MNSNLKCDLHLTASYISDQSWKPSITAKDPSVPRYSRSEQSESIQSVVWSKQSPCYWQLSWGISVLFNNKSFCFCSFEEPHFILSFLNIDYFQDCGSSPMRRSALRDVSQCANKSVTIREEENNYFSPHSSLQSNRYSPMKRPPPPYEQLNYIRHGNKGNNDNMVVVGNSTQDIFYDAETSLCQGKRKVTFKERRNRS